MNVDRPLARSRRYAAFLTPPSPSFGHSSQFRSGRQFAAWLGLTPRQHSSGGKDRLGRISKQGDGYVRRLLVHGARAVAGWRRRTTANPSPWLSGLLARRPMNVATVALANKNARIAWALLARGGAYRRGETARAACA